MKAPFSTIVNDGIKLIGNNKYLYDFIALQEIKDIPSQWGLLKKEINIINPTFLSNYNYSITTIGNAGIMTLFNKNYYTLIKVISSKFINNDRPIELLIFQENIIYINLHAPHSNVDIELIKMKIDLKLSVQEKIIIKFNFLKNKIIKLLYKAKRFIEFENKSNIKNFNNYRIIISGDFNDDIKNNFLNYKKYFKNLKFYKKKSLNTCCYISQNKIKNYKFDHILDSFNNNFKFLTLNKKIQTKYNIKSEKEYKDYMSDHIPVFAIL